MSSRKSKSVKPKRKKQVDKDLGERIKNTRLEQRCSQEALALGVGIKAETLRYIEKGYSSPRLDCLEKIAKVLGVDLEALIQEPLPVVTEIDAVAWHYPELAYSFAAIIEEALLMERRTVVGALSGSLVSTCALSDSLQTWLSKPVAYKSTVSVQTVGKIELAQVAQMKRIARELYIWQNRYGAGAFRKAAMALLHDISVAVQSKQSVEVEKALYGLLPELANIVAAMTWQAGLERQAQDYYKLALRAAHANADKLFGARILMGLSRQQMYLNNPKQAVTLVHLARQGTNKLAGPQVKAMLHIREAWALSALGQADAFERSVDLAHEQAAKGGVADEPKWAALLCSKSELSDITGAGLTELAKHNPKKYAELVSERKLNALKVRGENKDRLTVISYLDLAESRYLLNDLEFATVYTKKAIQNAESLQVTCAQVRHHFAKVYEHTKEHLKDASVRTVNRRLRQLLKIS